MKTQSMKKGSKKWSMLSLVVFLGGCPLYGGGGDESSRQSRQSSKCSDSGAGTLPPCNPSGPPTKPTP